MNEQSESQTTEIPKKEHAEPIGLRVLGVHDPRTMTEEQFNSDPYLLFHGARSEFEWQHDFDYSGKVVKKRDIGSATLGFGFYAADSEAEAAKYSCKRQGKTDAQPIIVRLLPYQARMFDFRAKGDPLRNGNVSKAFAQAWRDYYFHYLQRRGPRVPDQNEQPPLKPHGVLKGIKFTPISERLARIEEEYKKYLEDVLRLDYIDLRVLLRTAHHKLNNLNPSTSPLWSDLFREFIQAQGYDGIIYNESGDAEHFESTPSYVFTSTEKISTYQGWQQK